MVLKVVVKQKDNRTSMVSLLIHVVVKDDNLFAVSKQYYIVMKSLDRWSK
jgi:hypothetical protein